MLKLDIENLNSLSSNTDLLLCITILTERNLHIFIILLDAHHIWTLGSCASMTTSCIVETAFIVTNLVFFISLVTFVNCAHPLIDFL
jgi:hypothetical protein